MSIRAPFFSLIAGLLLGASLCQADQLTLYFYPAPRRLDWNSPRSLAVTTAINSILPSPFPLSHSIGHAAVRLKCGEDEVLTGMTNQNDSDESDAILHDGVGLGVLFQTFAGRLQTPQEIQGDLDARIPAGKVASISFDVSSATCARMMTYFHEYSEKGDARNYGLNLRPRYGEGGGCSAFAMSFLDVAGLLDPEFVSSWSRTLEVPEPLIKHDDKNVSIWSVLFSFHSWHWGSPGSDSREIFFWDPESAYYWILDQTQGSAPNLVYDKTAVPTPTDPIWLQNQ